MQKTKTYFDQVPIDEAKRIAEIEQQDETNGTIRGASREKFKDNVLEMGAVKQERWKTMTPSFEVSLFESGKDEMPSGELSFPEWQVPLQDLILEFNSEKLSQKMMEVEGLIAKRLPELESGQNGRPERQAIGDALTILRVIKRDRLGFPDWQ